MTCAVTIRHADAAPLVTDGPFTELTEVVVGGVYLFAADDRDSAPDRAVRDDELGLLFTCCHPALARDAQVALTLGVVGLTSGEIGRAFLRSEAAGGQAAHLREGQDPACCDLVSVAC